MSSNNISNNNLSNNNLNKNDVSTNKSHHKFVHLHNHTEYSLLDGAIRVDDLIATAREFDMPAVAITDHGVLYGMIEFYRKARAAGIKPLLGCEIYLTPGSRFDKDTRERYHLVLLALNNEGYHNLIKIVSAGWLEGFYYKPRVDKDLLFDHSEGLIALSACVQGEIPRLLLAKKEEQARETIREYQAIFGRENFYLELQDHNLRQEKRVNSKLIALARDMEVPLVVTNDSHYLQQEHADLHDILLALQTGTTINDEDRLTFTGNQFYLKDRDDMVQLFPELKDAYKNTVEIADRCNVELDFNTFYLPDYPDLENGQSAAALLREKCETGLEQRGLDGDKQARERLQYELEIIEEMGYVSYFLIVWDFVNYAQENNIMVGPGRGSAAGSLVSYLLGITKINPLKYNLIFERFLNPERVTMPDIDIDFDDRRDEIIEYVKRRYGQEKVAQIGTFGTMAARGAIRDVGRVLDLPYKKVDRIAKMIPAQPGITLEEALAENSKLSRDYQGDEQVKELLDYALQIEGLPRHISTHAAGVIIGPDALTDIIPLQFQDESVITQLPMGELEDLGLLKMDFLGLRNLTVIKKTLHMIAEDEGRHIDIDNIPLDDDNVYQMLQAGKTMGVFQMESYLFQDLNKRLKPEYFEDLIALLALGRPGPLGSGLVDDFIQSRHGEKKPAYLHPTLKPILKQTFGMILYQEQVMQIAGELADYSMGEADLLRRGMGKKKKKLVAKEREKFVDGARNNGIEEDTAHEIFDQMEYFAGYGFNKSHSAAYALLAYQTAYLKANYPSQFMAALLSSVMSNLDKVGVYIRECKQMGMEVLPPDINESKYDFTSSSSGEIRFGLKAIKNVGKNAIKTIVDSRQEESYNSFRDFLKKVDLSQLNVQTLEALIKSGAMDSLGLYRRQLLIKFEEEYERAAHGQKRHKKGQTSFFDLVEDEDQFYKSDIEYPEVDELDFEDKLAMEKEYLGIYVSGHPLAIYQDKIERFTSVDCRQSSANKLAATGENKLALAGIIINVREITTKNKKRMAFITLEDMSGKRDIVVFPDVYNSLKFSPEQGLGIYVIGYKDDDSFIAENIFSLNRDFLEIDVSQLAEDDFSTLQQRLTSGAGEVPVFLCLDQTQILTGKKFWIDRELLAEDKMEQLLGKDKYRFY